MTVDGNSQSSFLVIQVKEQFKVTHEKLPKGLTSERTLSGFREAEIGNPSRGGSASRDYRLPRW